MYANTCNNFNLGSVGRQPLATLLPGKWLHCGDMDSAGIDYYFYKLLLLKIYPVQIYIYISV